MVVKMGRVSLPLFIKHSNWLTDVRPSARFMSKFILKKNNMPRLHVDFNLIPKIEENEMYEIIP